MSLQSNHAAYIQRRARERAEDLRWMLDSGESMAGAAARFGITENALEKWCERNNFHAEAITLRSRNPIDPTRDLSEQGRAGALARWAS